MNQDLVLLLRKWLPLALHLLFVICLLIVVYSVLDAALYMDHQLPLPLQLPWPLIPLADIGVLLLAPVAHKKPVVAVTRAETLFPRHEPESEE